MQNIFTYLSKYKNLIPPEESKKKIIIQSIQDECGIKVSKKEISLRGGGVTLTCHPTIKSELSQCAPRVINTLLTQHNIRISFIR